MIPLARSNVYDAIVLSLRSAGYDFITAHGLAKAKVRELNASPAGTYTFMAGDDSITVNKGPTR